MNLAGFYRNCLSKGYMAAAKEKGIDMNYDEARQVICGMPFDEWKKEFQKEATSEQLKDFEEAKPLHAVISGHNKGG